MALFVHRSNRTEQLVALLADVLAEPLRSALSPEHIVVQGSGMERWLTGRLSAHFGVWAQPSFPFPRTAAELVLSAFLGPPPETAARFEPAQLTLHVAAALPRLLDEPALAPYRAYVRDDTSGTRLFALATELAQCFDRYAVYRPELLRTFERGEGDGAQGRVWCAVSDGARDAHFAARALALVARARDLVPSSELPERMSLFGLSALAPSLLSVFRAAAMHVPVHAFLLVPVREYYDDLDRSERHRRDVSGLVGHLGRMIRELDHDLRALEGPDVVLDDQLSEPVGTHLLARLQASMLELDFAAPERTPIAADDDSIRLHVCANKTRELEVLRDELRHRLERDPSLAPRDIVVLVPDVESYALAIDAVFGDLRASSALPYRVVDTAPAQRSSAATALFGLVDLVRGRLTLTELLDFLHAPDVRFAFDVSDDELGQFETWLEQAGARFGLGARDASGARTPHSIGFALDRVLLGLTLPDAAAGVFRGMVPAPTVEGKSSESLGKLARILGIVERLAEQLRQPKSVADHAACLIRATELLLGGTDARDPFCVVLTQSLARIAADANACGATSPVDVRSVIALVRSALSSAATATAFLSGEVVFCQHVPMRAIPFRVLCMAGMDELSFPRPARDGQLDLASATPRRGDRNARDDDRQLFLDALLSARDALILSYVSEAEGGSEQRGPSTAVGQLLRALDAHFVPAQLRAGVALSALIMRSHPRLAFDARYFTDASPAGFRSYDAQAFALARQLAERTPARKPFAERALEPPEARPDLAIDELVRFWKHPQKTFLAQRLGVRLWSAEAELGDREPVLLSGLSRYAAGERVLRVLARLPADDRAAIMSRSGELPKGMLGTVQLKSLEHMGALLRELATARAGRLGPPAPPLRIDLPLRGSERLLGQLGNMQRGGRSALSFGAVNAKRRLQAWIEHLALLLALPEASQSVLVGRATDGPDLLCFGPVANAEGLLAELVGWYRLGLSAPLPFFPNASFAYARAVLGGSAPAEALGRALRAMKERGGDGETRRDPHLEQCFEPLSEASLAQLRVESGGAQLDFARLSLGVFGPLIAAEKASEDA